MSRASLFSVGFMAFALGRVHPFLALAVIPAALTTYPVWWVLGVVPVIFSLVYADPYALVAALIAVALAYETPYNAVLRIAKQYTVTRGYKYGSMVYDWYVAVLVGISVTAAVASFMLPEIAFIVPFMSVVLMPPSPPLDRVLVETAVTSPLLRFGSAIRLVYPALVGKAIVSRIMNALSTPKRVFAELSTIVDPVFSLLPTRAEDFADLVRQRVPRPVIEVAVAAAIVVVAAYLGFAGGVLGLLYVSIASLTAIHAVFSLGLKPWQTALAFTGPTLYALKILGFGPAPVAVAAFVASTIMLAYNVFSTRNEQKDIGVVSNALTTIDPVGEIISSASPRASSLALRAKHGIPIPGNASPADLIIYTVSLLAKLGKLSLAKRLIDFYLHRKDSIKYTEAIGLASILAATTLLYNINPYLAVATALALAITPRLALLSSMIAILSLFIF